jgi:hypothetical protein
MFTISRTLPLKMTLIMMLHTSYNTLYSNNDSYCKKKSDIIKKSVVQNKWLNVKITWPPVIYTKYKTHHTQHLFTVKKKIPQLSQIPIAQGDWWQFIQRKPLIFYKSSEKKILKIIFSNQHVLPMYVNNMIYTTLTFKFKISGQFLKKVTLC